MIVSLADFRRELGLPETTEQTILLKKLKQAEAMVLDYLARPTDADWTATIATWGTSAGSPPSLVVALNDNTITQAEWLVAFVAAVTATGLVYQVKNS